MPQVLRPYLTILLEPVRSRWVRARYRAERHEIARRYAKWEITGEPEIRRADAGTFNPFR